MVVVILIGNDRIRVMNMVSSELMMVFRMFVLEGLWELLLLKKMLLNDVLIIFFCDS